MKMKNKILIILFSNYTKQLRAFNLTTQIFQKQRNKANCT